MSKKTTTEEGPRAKKGAQPIKTTIDFGRRGGYPPICRVNPSHVKCRFRSDRPNARNAIKCERKAGQRNAMQMRCKCGANAMQTRCNANANANANSNANVMQMQCKCNANANANATRCNTRRAMSVLTINPQVELACAFSALFVKT